MVFSLNDPARVESLLRDAGFRDVHTHRYHRTMDLPAPAEFFWQYVSSTPLIGLVPGPDDAATAALERDIVTAWQPWLHDGGMRYDQAMLVASARR